MSTILMVGSIAGCAGTPEQPNPEEPSVSRTLALSVGDSYDFTAMGLFFEKAEGDCVQISAEENVLHALAPGNCTVQVRTGKEIHAYDVTVYSTARELGGKYELDRGMFAGKKVIVFGDSITDGLMVNETNYEDTYFALLCRYLAASNDPTDLVNSNFACSGTTLS